MTLDSNTSWTRKPAVVTTYVTKSAIEAVTEVLREEVAALGIRVMAVEPGAFRTRAYAGFVDEAVSEPIAKYLPMLEQVRAEMIEQDGAQPGEPQRGTRAQ